MANFKYDDIWELLEKYNFDIDMNLFKDLVCMVCKKLLRNATQNPCGCRYCNLCILTYLNGEEKCCPKDVDDCKDYIINSENDLQIDHAANKKISLIKVKCPESFCAMMIELRNMTEHVKSHELKCPYYPIGCNQQIISDLELQTHLNEDSHRKLLVDVIGNMKSEIVSLKENLLEKERTIEDLKASNIDLREEIVNLKKFGMESIKDKLKSLEEDSQYKQNLINDIVGEHVKKRNNEKYFEEKLEKSQNNSNMNTIQSSKCLPARSYLYQSQSLPRPTMGRKCAPFNWFIRDFLTKLDNARNGIEKCIFSDIFLSHNNGYSLRLCFYPNGFKKAENTHITVLFTIVPSELDHKLEWPMKREITVALIDQVSETFYVSEKYKYDSVEKNNKYVFHKPYTQFTNEIFNYGSPKFAKLNSLVNNSRLFKNDAILLRCLVD